MFNTFVLNLQVIAAVLLFALGIGWGWARVLSRNSNFATFGQFTLALSLTPVISGLTAIPVVLLRLDGHMAMVLCLFISASGYLVGYSKNIRKPTSISAPKPTHFGRYMFLIAGLWMLVLSLQVNTNGEVTTGARVGPDLFGYASAAFAINDGLGLEEVQNQIDMELSLAGLNPSNGNVGSEVYSVSSFPAQVDAEFLLGAKRFGLAIFEALIIRSIGEDRAWAVQSTIGSISFLTLMLMTFKVSVSNVKKVSKRHLFVPIMIALNVNLLYVWIEGGVGQVWVLPTLLMLVWIYTRESLGRLEGFVAAACLGSLVFTYFDAYVVFIGFTILAISCEFAIRRRLGLRTKFTSTFLLSSILFALIMNDQILAQLGSRLSDSGIAGWSTPSWLSVSEAFGLFNSFEGMRVIPRSGINLPMVQNSSMIQFIASMAFSAVILYLIAQALIQIQNSYLMIFVVITMTFLVALWAKTKFIDDASNYQYLKAITIVLPVFFLVAALYIRSLSFKDLSSRLRDFSLLALGLLVASNLQLHQQWRAETYWLANSTSQNFAKTNTEKILSKYSVVNGAGYLDSFLIVNRNLKFTEPGRVGSKDFKVAAIIDRLECDKRACTSEISPDKFLMKSTHVYIIDLPIAGNEIGKDTSNQEFCSKIATKWSEINGIPMGQCGYW